VGRIERAIERARACSNELPPPSSRGLGQRPRRFAIGDPQAPLTAFLAVLDHHGLLGDDGWIAGDVGLVSVGDHFDYGALAEAHEAANDGLCLLSWLAHHDEDAVVLIAGNHDLGRVGELASFDDERFARMQQEAALTYRGGDVDEEAHRTFLERWPELPTAEVGARDFAAYCAAQRTLVTHLLRQGRLHLAWAASDSLLIIHAGVTRPQLERLGIDPAGGAIAIARALDERLAEAVRRWRGPPERLAIEHVHRPGDARSGEGGGLLYHRAANGARPDDERRFDPRDLPPGLVQATGHVRDKKLRKLLGPWADDVAARDGVLRHLVVRDGAVSYRHGLPQVVDARAATMLFLDGGMNYTPADTYELLDLTRC
jgi:hypothetical protein